MAWGAAVAIWLAAGPGHADAPARIHYQGRLLDTNGAPVNGSVDIGIGLYTNATAGASHFSQAVGPVTVVNGMFDFAFGTNTLEFRAVFTNAAVWIGVSVDGAALVPRQQLMAVPYALTAGRVPDLTLGATGTAAGVEADGRDGGVAVGFQARAYSAALGLGGGVAMGQSADGADYGMAAGLEAQASGHGVAAGYQALGYDHGAAIGNQAFAAGTNVAVGAGAVASGVNRTALGPAVVNDTDNSTAVRGALYLDGASGIFHRPAFGSGGWSPGLPGGWSGILTNVSGTRTQLLYYASGMMTNVVVQ